MIAASILWVLIHGQSMLPDLQHGHTYPFEAVVDSTTISRGDVIVFRNGLPPDSIKVKVVTAVAGDTLSRMTIPGTAIQLALPKRYRAGAVISEGWYYVLGTNWRNSRDSRTFGLIPRRDIRGVMRKDR